MGLTIPQLQIPSQNIPNKGQNIKRDPFSSPQAIATPVNELLNVNNAYIDRKSSKSIFRIAWENDSC
jgi:hypothetical protein